jgi:hypothetical protein
MTLSINKMNGFALLIGTIRLSKKTPASGRKRPMRISLLNENGPHQRTFQL